MAMTDFEYFADLIGAFLSDMPPDAWEQRTGERAKDWTLHQTLAHLVSIAMLFNRAADAALNNHPLAVAGLARRIDLRNWNDAEIAIRQNTPPDGLIEQLTELLHTAGQSYAELTPESGARTAFLRVYNRPASVRDFLDWQLSHAGVIHAAQITRPLDAPPLWERYTPEFTCRQVDRFIRHFSAAYWGEAAPHLLTTFNFHIAGCGVWHLVAAPDGGSAGTGAVEDAPYNWYFSDPATLFGLFTFHLPFPAADRLRIEGDVEQALAIIKLFAAAPPTPYKPSA